MEILSFLIFAFLSCVIILSALGVFFAKKLSYSLICMVVCFFAISGIFFLLNADFVAASQIMLYGVSAAILMVFAIMLVSSKDKTKNRISLSRSLIGGLFSGCLFFIILFAFFSGDHLHKFYLFDSHSSQSVFSSSKIASELFTSSILPFEILSLLLLLLILGAAVIAGREEK